MSQPQSQVVAQHILYLCEQLPQSRDLQFSFAFLFISLYLLYSLLFVAAHSRALSTDLTKVLMFVSAILGAISYLNFKYNKKEVQEETQERQKLREQRENLQKVMAQSFNNAVQQDQYKRMASTGGSEKSQFLYSSFLGSSTGDTFYTQSHRRRVQAPVPSSRSTRWAPIVAEGAQHRELSEAQRVLERDVERRFLQPQRDVAAQLREAEDFDDGTVMRLYPHFDARKSDERAAANASRLLGGQHLEREHLHVLAERTKYYVLNYLLGVYLNVYTDTLKELCFHLNEKFYIMLIPDEEISPEDMMDPVLVILNDQGMNVEAHKFDKYQKLTFKDLDRKLSTDMQRQQVGGLNQQNRAKLQKLWKEHLEIAQVFAGAGNVSNRHAGNYGYTLKRLYQLWQDHESYNHKGTGYYGRGFQRQIVHYQGKPWDKHRLPSDSELVASFFARILDSTSQNLRDGSRFEEYKQVAPKLMSHMISYNDSLLLKEVPEDMVGLLCQVPQSYIPHFQVFSERRVMEVFSGDNNLFYGILTVVRILFKKNKNSQKYVFVNEAYKHIFESGTNVMAGARI